MSDKNSLLRQVRLAVAAAERQDDGRKLPPEILDEISAANLALSRVRGTDVLRIIVQCRGGGISLALPLERHLFREVPEKERRPENPLSRRF